MIVRLHKADVIARLRTKSIVWRKEAFQTAQHSPCVPACYRGRAQPSLPELSWMRA
jgi:hypothetical protein